MSEGIAIDGPALEAGLRCFVETFGLKHPSSELLVECFAGEVTADDRETVERHLITCPECLMIAEMLQSRYSSEDAWAEERAMGASEQRVLVFGVKHLDRLSVRESTEALAASAQVSRSVEEVFEQEGVRVLVRISPAKSVQAIVERDGAPAVGTVVGLERVSLANGLVTLQAEAVTDRQGLVTLGAIDALPLPGVDERYRISITVD